MRYPTTWVSVLLAISAGTLEAQQFPSNGSCVGPNTEVRRTRSQIRLLTAKGESLVPVDSVFCVRVDSVRVPVERTVMRVDTITVTREVPLQIRERNWVKPVLWTGIAAAAVCVIYGLIEYGEPFCVRMRNENNNDFGLAFLPGSNGPGIGVRLRY